MMASKKSTVAISNRASTGQWVVKGVLERRAASIRFVAHAEQVALSTNKSRRVAHRAGVITESGRLTKHYKK
jgi:hypothetical protein